METSAAIIALLSKKFLRIRAGEKAYVHALRAGLRVVCVITDQEAVSNSQWLLPLVGH